MLKGYKTLVRVIVTTSATAVIALSASVTASAGAFTERADALGACVQQLRAEAGEGRILVTKSKRRGGKHKFWINKYKGQSSKREAKAFCVVHPDEGVMEFTIDR